MEIGETPAEVIATEQPKRKSFTDKIGDFILNNKKEAFFMNWNLSLFMWEVLKDTGHIIPGDPGAIQGISIGKNNSNRGCLGFY